MRTSCLGGFSVMWVTKLLNSPVKIWIFCPKTIKFGLILAFLFILGQALQNDVKVGRNSEVDIVKLQWCRRERQGQTQAHPLTLCFKEGVCGCYQSPSRCRRWRRREDTAKWRSTTTTPTLDADCVKDDMKTFIIEQFAVRSSSWYADHDITLCGHQNRYKLDLVNVDSWQKVQIYESGVVIQHSE